MYRLLLVDDEELEREGMEKLIPWKEYGIQLIGTARNGEEGYQAARREKPDLIITDIKMPLLDGIGMIRKIREEALETEIIVLSGYGEYEFTSQAMEEGVRHYILKPVDEEKIRESMQKAIRELEQRRSQHQALNQAARLRPIAMQQIFPDWLLGRNDKLQELERAAEEYGMAGSRIMLLAFRRSGRVFDSVEGDALENILNEVLGAETIFALTFTEEEAVFLIRALHCADDFPAVRVLREVDPDRSRGVVALLSGEGSVSDLPELYQEIRLLYRMKKIEKGIFFLHFGLFEGEISPNTIFDYPAIYRTKSYPELLFELYLASLKMSYAGYDERIKSELFRWICELFSFKDGEGTVKRETQPGSSAFSFSDAADIISRQKNFAWTETKEERQKREILVVFFRNISDKSLSIRMLSHELLFMNEDYFGRLFRKMSGEKFNSYLQHIRILLAQRLMQYQPDMRIQDLAMLIGYAEDGQYFSKAFRKESGASPSEYRRKLIQ